MSSAVPTADEDETAAPETTPLGPRAAARQAAVQAVFQRIVTEMPVSDILAEFIEHRLGLDSETDAPFEIDRELFVTLVRGTDAEHTQLDSMVEFVVAEGWSMNRLDRVLHAILRCGGYELLAMPDVPARVTINEYVEVARDFFDGKEPGFVNGALDRMARAIRPDEVRPDAPPPEMPPAPLDPPDPDDGAA